MQGDSGGETLIADFGHGNAFDNKGVGLFAHLPLLVRYQLLELLVQRCTHVNRTRAALGKLFFRSFGNHATTPNDDEVIGGQSHFAHEVRTDEDSSSLVSELLKEVTDPSDTFGVESVDWFVEHQCAGVAQERGGNTEALAHAERKVTRTAICYFCQTHNVENFVDAAQADPVR